MQKSPFGMSPDEYQAWQAQENAHAREYLFSIGQPLVYEKDGQLIAEYPDGTIKPI
ncbi:hypothetical protein HH214_09810 [Mucilaginibacter robiniae]|uniref:Uncharacterized protein n=1 Tax=Mucilaginibacter robiniae TaxID=2728022 RepID=A0A7L5E6Z6_9SPHI|nr:hypothetical protein [Mucilaginibacter robiniae]QJD96146.1 hypothetical protein HH214_09810 [Mucilaginibacter robiniae]